jgi:hypothetical protein
MQDVSPDHDDRLEDFFDRHGGRGSQPERNSEANEVQGWSEVYARDGYALRCEWSSFGSRKEMKYSEIAPAAASES